MSEPIHLAGAGHIDICAVDGVWRAVYWLGRRVSLLHQDNYHPWHVDVDARQLRCACDDIGLVLAVGQHHDTGQLVIIHDGDIVAGDWGHAGGVNSVACAFLDDRWHTWQMGNGHTYTHRELHRDTLEQLAVHVVNISDVFPDGTSHGISYIKDGLPQFTDLHRELKDTQGRVVLTLPNPAGPGFGQGSWDPAGHIWIGQGGRGLAAWDADNQILQTVADVFAGEPHIARLGHEDFVACCRTLSDAVIQTFSIPLTQDFEQDLPVTDPGRPFFIGAFHHVYDRATHPSWGTLTVPSSLDVLSDNVAPVRPSLIGPDAIFSAPNDDDFVKGLFVTLEGGSPGQVEEAIRIVREIWVARHTGSDIPPVVVYLTEAQRIMFGDQWATATSADLYAPECYFDLTFPAEPVNDIAQERLAWLTALGQSRPLLPVCQAFDRNGAHAAHMGTVAHLLPEYLTEWASALNCKGLLFFDVNRSGMTSYPELRRQFERIAAVCTAPQQLHPWTPAPNPQAPPLIKVVSDKTRVTVGESVIFTVQLLPGSGPLRAHVEWLEDEIGDGQPAHRLTETTAFSISLSFERARQLRILARVSGPGGTDTSDESDSPLITVEPAKEPEMPFPSDQEQHDALVQIHHQGYIGFLGRPEGLFTTTGDPSELSSPDGTKRLDAVGLAVWQGRYTQIFATTPGNPPPSRHDHALRRTLRGLWESDEANHPLREVPVEQGGLGRPPKPPWPWEDPQ